MIALNYRDSVPIYEQIMNSYRKLIITGVMKPDEKLPSVRSLAVELSINPNTIQRAYAGLESEGYVYSVGGKGSFVSGNIESLQERKTDLLMVIRKTASELFMLNASEDEIFAAIREGRDL